MTRARTVLGSSPSGKTSCSSDSEATSPKGSSTTAGLEAIALAGFFPVDDIIGGKCAPVVVVLCWTFVGEDVIGDLRRQSVRCGGKRFKPRAGRISVITKGAEEVLPKDFLVIRTWKLRILNLVGSSTSSCCLPSRRVDAESGKDGIVAKRKE